MEVLDRVKWMLARGSVPRQVSAARWLDVLDCIGHPRNSWFATPESAVLADEEVITHPTAVQSALRRAGFQACAWLVSQDCRIWKD